MPTDSTPSEQMRLWVQTAIQQSGKTYAEVAREMTRQGVGVYDRSKVQKMARGTRKVSAVEEAAISRITGVPRPGETHVPHTAHELLILYAKLDDRGQRLLLETAELLARREDDGLDGAA